MPDMQDLIDAQNRAFEELKKADTQRRNEIAKVGEAHSLTVESQKKIEAALDRLETKATETAAENKAAKLWQDNVDAILLKLQKPGEYSGDQKDANHIKAFDMWIRKSDPTYLREMNISVGPDGGFLIPGPALLAMRELAAPFCPVRQLATVETISTESITVPVEYGDAEVLWNGERDTREETDAPSSKLVLVPTHEMTAYPRASLQFVEDVQTNVLGYITRHVARRFAKAENIKFTTGDGVMGPRGLLGGTPVALASKAWGSISYVPSGASGDFASSLPVTYVAALMDAVPEQYHAGAAFMAARSVKTKMRTMTDGGGGTYWWNPPQGNAPATFMGFPVYENDAMAAMASNSYSLMFGNFAEAYLVADRIGISVRPDPYTAAGFIKYHCRARVGGSVVNWEAVAVMKFASS